ncbi:MAG: hypothetical protein AB1Z29_16870 [Desulfobacterales bacterium]
MDGPFYKTEADQALIEAYDWPDPDNPGLYRGLKTQAEDLHNFTDYAVILDLGKTGEPADGCYGKGI